MLNRIGKHGAEKTAATVLLACLAFLSRDSTASQPECAAPQAVELVDTFSSLADLVAGSQGEDVPFRNEAAAILATWMGRSLTSDARAPVDAERLALAKRIFGQCADAGSAGAHLLVGATLSGAGAREPDLLRAAKEFELARAGGVSVASLGSAVVAYRLDKPKSAERSLRILIKSDKQITPERIGLMLIHGTIFPKSSENAKFWLVIAARRDNSAEAQHELYRMYSTGDGVVRSDSEARKWRTMLEKNPAGNRKWDEEQEIKDSLTTASPN